MAVLAEQEDLSLGQVALAYESALLGIAEGAKEDKASWQAFLRHLKERGLKGVRLFTTDKALGLVESLGDEDLCLCLISGGGSALMPAPVEGITLDDKLAKGKVKAIGELVMLDAERCVLCTRCVRFMADYAKAVHQAAAKARTDGEQARDWPESKAWAAAAKKIKNSGKVRCTGLSTHSEVPIRTKVLRNAAGGGWVEAIMVASGPSRL